MCFWAAILLVRILILNLNINWHLYLLIHSFSPIPVLHIYSHLFLHHDNKRYFFCCYFVVVYSRGFFQLVILPHYDKYVLVSFLYHLLSLLIFMFKLLSLFKIIVNCNDNFFGLLHSKWWKLKKNFLGVPKKSEVAMWNIAWYLFSFYRDLTNHDMIFWLLVCHLFY